MPRSRRVTISDVAAASGVGVGTVSRVINGAANVREATRLSVLRVIEQLGYRPSHLASSLSRGTQRTAAIVVPHLTRPSTVERLAGALAVLGEQGYDTVIYHVDAPAQRDHFLAMLTTRHRADGVIVMSLKMAREQLAAFRVASIPLVTVDISAPGLPQTLTDDIAGGRLAAAQLISLGHRRIGFIGERAARADVCLAFGASRRRREGVRRELEAAGLRLDRELVRLGPHEPAAAADLAEQLLALPDPPTAIVAASDTQAVGVLSAAERAGVGVPELLSVIGFDDLEAAALLGLSTVHQPLRHSGAEAARRLCALLRGEAVRPLRQMLALRLVQRSSCGAPRTFALNGLLLTGKKGYAESGRPARATRPSGTRRTGPHPVLEGI